MEIGAVGDPSTGQIKIDFDTYRSKRSRPAATPAEGVRAVKDEHLETPEDDFGVDGDQHARPNDKSKRNQGASVAMKGFMEHFPALQECILSTFYHPKVGSNCRCSKGEALYRCCGTEHCHEPDLLCATCVVQAHQTLPLHYIERWNGKHFEPSSLKELGLTIYLGHHGVRCPNSSDAAPPVSMTAVHTNGFHQVRIQFCYCMGAAARAIQLAKSEYFPGTMDKPETFYTFGLLDNFHIDTLTSKKSLYDYHAALVKMTNAVFPQDVPDRYHELSRVARVWAHLAIQRRSGQGHGIDEILTSWRPGSLTVRCPACPHVGINVDQDTLDQASEQESHKHTLFLSADGNFRLQRKNKKDDADDVSLSAGNGYFVNTKAYKTYLACAKDVDDTSICAHLRANRLQNVIKFKNAVVSGVVAIQCARHGFFSPQGMVDLKKGEAYARTDYALVNSLADARNLRWIFLSYDIWCSYGVNLKKRFTEYFGKAACICDKIRGAVPKMHVKNHIEKCQLLWAFNYLRNTGETYGEKIESSWGEGNQAGGSTKEMNEGYRHDTLNDFHGFWNFLKMIGLAMAIFQAYVKCLSTLKNREKNFGDFNACISPELVKVWEAMDDTPRIEKGQVVLVHVAKFGKGPPTQIKAYQDYLALEVLKVQKGEGRLGETQLINSGLDIEHLQQKIRQLASIKEVELRDAQQLQDSRRRLRKHLVNYRAAQHTLLPQLEDRMAPINDDTPEEADLLLPSSFSAEDRRAYRLEELAKVEYAIREGRAYDALESLRKSIQVYNHNLGFKKTQVRGQGPNTRAEEYLRTLARDKISAADKYRNARRGLLALGLSPNDQTLQDLRDDQLWSKNTSVLAKLGDNTSGKSLWS